jgi:hypothetical protein
MENAARMQAMALIEDYKTSARVQREAEITENQRAERELQQRFAKVCFGFDRRRVNVW